jgi:acylphosphatase
MANEERAHVFVSGEVQGVNFRGATQSQAEQLDLNGWVQNLQDGRVEAIFEGEPVIDKKQFQLDDLKGALKYLDAGKHTGKVVIEI